MVRVLKVRGQRCGVWLLTQVTRLLRDNSVLRSHSSFIPDPVPLSEILGAHIRVVSR